jgi:hypothetical protein
MTAHAKRAASRIAAQDDNDVQCGVIDGVHSICNASRMCSQDRRQGFPFVTLHTYIDVHSVWRLTHLKRRGGRRLRVEEELPLFLLHGLGGRGVVVWERFLLCRSFVFLLLSPVLFLWCALSLLGQAWAEGKGELATSRHRTDSGQETDSASFAMIFLSLRSRPIIIFVTCFKSRYFVSFSKPRC